MFNVSKLMSLWKSLGSPFTFVFDIFKYFKLNRVTKKSGSLVMPEPSRSKALKFQPWRQFNAVFSANQKRVKVCSTYST